MFLYTNAKNRPLSVTAAPTPTQNAAPGEPTTRTAALVNLFCGIVACEEGLQQQLNFVLANVCRSPEMAPVKFEDVLFVPFVLMPLLGGWVLTCLLETPGGL